MYSFFAARFADRDSFEYEYGVRWKRLYEMYKEKKMLLESDLQAEVEQLERRLAIVKHEHETEKLRQGGCCLIAGSFFPGLMCDLYIEGCVLVMARILCYQKLNYYLLFYHYYLLYYLFFCAQNCLQNDKWK